MTQHYVAVVRKEADSDFRAFFPDFSCVIASAPTLAEAIKKAAQALALNAKQTLADGKPLPEPSGPSQILADPAYRTRCTGGRATGIAGDPHMSTRPKPRALEIVRGWRHHSQLPASARRLQLITS